MCCGVATLCAGRILPAYEFTVQLYIHILRSYSTINNFYCDLLKCETDPCSDKSKFDF